jgi:hypothetical protein
MSLGCLFLSVGSVQPDSIVSVSPTISSFPCETFNFSRSQFLDVDLDAIPSSSFFVNSLQRLSRAVTTSVEATED